MKGNNDWEPEQEIKPLLDIRWAKASNHTPPYWENEVGKEIMEKGERPVQWALSPLQMLGLGGTYNFLYSHWPMIDKFSSMNHVSTIMSPCEGTQTGC